MTDIYLDPISNDIYLENNLARLTEKEEELIRQKLLITISTFRGEWGFNINFGIPYIANENNPVQIMGKGNKRLLDILLRAAILNTEGVESFVNYSSIQDPQLRSVTINFSVNTDSGNIVSVTGTI